MKRWMKALVLFVLVAAFSYAVFLYFSPDGARTYTYKPGVKRFVITDLFPADRVEYAERNLETHEVYQRVKDEPIYFDVIMPRLYQKATVEIEMLNKTQPAVYLGLKTDDAFSFDLLPLQYKILEDPSWKRIDDTVNNFSIYLHTESYGTTVQEILDHLTPESEIYELDVPVSEKLTLDDYEPLNTSRTIPISLRGPHNMKTYANQGESVEIGVDWYDINRSFNEDKVFIRAYTKEGLMIGESSTQDDNDSTGSGNFSGPFHTELAFEAPYEGIYTIQIQGTDDLIIKQLESNSRYLVFKSLFFAGPNEYPLENAALPTIYTNSTNLAFNPGRETSNQTVIIDKKPIDLVFNKTNEWEDLFSKNIHEIRVDYGDLRIEGNGYFFISPTMYFFPSNGVKKYNVATPVPLEKIEVLFAPNYQPVEDLPGEWIKSKGVYQIQINHVRKNNTLSFMISAPGVRRQQDLLIREIRVTLEKEPITWKNFYQKLKGLIERAL